MRRIKIIVQTKLMFCLFLLTPTSVFSQRNNFDNRKSTGNINGRYTYHQQNPFSNNYWYHWWYHNSGNQYSRNNQRLQQSFPFSKDVGSNGNGFWSSPSGNSGTSVNHLEKPEEKRNLFRIPGNYLRSKNGFDRNKNKNLIHASGGITVGQPQDNSYQHHQFNKFNQRAGPYDHRRQWFTTGQHNNIFQPHNTGGNEDHPAWNQWQQSDGRLSYDGMDDKSSFEHSGESSAEPGPNIQTSSAEDQPSNFPERGESTVPATAAESPFLLIGAPPPFISALNFNGPPHNVYLNSFGTDSRPNNNDNSEDSNNNNNNNNNNRSVVVVVVEPPVLDLTTQDQINLLVEAQQFCGQGSDLGEDTDATLRIARGHAATKMYPWLVAIYRAASGKEMQFSCGGSLITSKHAISAAHCFISSESSVQYEFIVSNNRILKPSEAAKTLRTADRIVLHPGYNPQAMSANADVAIVVFDRPVEYGQFIRPICLWKGDTNIGGVRDATGRVVGWGANENVTIANELPLEIDMNILDYSTCILRDNTFINVIGENSFCTGNRDGSGPCMGDSGSGFMLQQDGRWSLRGVVSLTTELVGCDINHYVGITDVAKYQRWINTILKRG